MKRIGIGIFIDFVLMCAFWLCGGIRIKLLLCLAAGNIVFYLILLGLFLRKTGKLPDRTGFALEFVMIQMFLCISIFLYKLTDLMIAHNSL